MSAVVCISTVAVSSTAVASLTAVEESSEKLWGLPILPVGPDTTSSFRRMISLQRHTKDSGRDEVSRAEVKRGQSGVPQGQVVRNGLTWTFYRNAA